VEKDAVQLKPALRLVSHVSFVKEVAKGVSISYGGTFTAEKNLKVATIPVGYGDGYARGLSNQADVLIHGKRARILGRVCMDQFMADVTDIPDVKFMDEVVLIGKSGEEEITVEELSELSGRFNYEFVCCLGKRIPRVYKGGNL
jgi:alanine racemase